MNLLVWSIPNWLLAVLLCLMLRNRAYRAWPWFSAYVVFALAADLSRLATLGHAHTYFLTYWLTDVGYALLGAAAMYEVVSRLTRWLGDAWWWTRLIFPAMVAVGVGLSLLRAHYSPPHFGGLLYYVVVGEIAVRLIQVIAFIGLVGFFWFFEFYWSAYPFGITAGFGLYSTVALLITTKLSDFGTRFTFLWGVSSLVAYSLAVLIWIWSFRAPEREHPSLTPEQKAHYTALLEQYLDILRGRRRYDVPTDRDLADARAARS
jgi:hypothetical protein